MGKFWRQDALLGGEQGQGVAPQRCLRSSVSWGLPASGRLPRATTEKLQQMASENEKNVCSCVVPAHLET